MEIENDVKVEASKFSEKIIKRRVVLNGTTDIMFDRYAGDNQTKLEPWQKLYLIPGTRQICLPMANIVSFMSAQNTDSAPKLLLPARDYKKVGQAFLSYTAVSPNLIPFTRFGKPIEFGEIKEDVDLQSKVYLHRTVARLKGGVPNAKVRPVLPAPWTLEFTLTLYPGAFAQEQQFRNVFAQGGEAVGLGTFRKVFGKFEVVCWE